jgi:hypothetical protein
MRGLILVFLVVIWPGFGQEVRHELTAEEREALVTAADEGERAVVTLVIAAAHSEVASCHDGSGGHVANILTKEARVVGMSKETAYVTVRETGHSCRWEHYLLSPAGWAGFVDGPGERRWRLAQGAKWAGPLRVVR